MAKGTKLAFAKMHGGGNDFVLIDAVRQQIPPTLDFSRLANRRVGVGCDQVLILQPPLDDTADFCYRIINADGGEVGQCGNGARCAHLLVRRWGLSSKARLRLQTTHTDIITEDADGGLVRAYLATPQFAPPAIPLGREREADFYTAELVGETRQFAALSLGNPHAVFFVATEPAVIDGIGTVLNADKTLFPAGVNAGFCHATESGLQVRVYERGVGETPSCGSGAVAAAVAAIRAGIAHSPVTVQMKGGVLRCGWDAPTKPAWLEGPVTYAFDGELSTADFSRPKQ